MSADCLYLLRRDEFGDDECIGGPFKPFDDDALEAALLKDLRENKFNDAISYRALTLSSKEDPLIEAFLGDYLGELMVEAWNLEEPNGDTKAKES